MAAWLNNIPSSHKNEADMQQGIQHYAKRQLFSIHYILKGVLALILTNVALHSFALTTADNSVANDIKPMILKASKSIAHSAPPLEMTKPHLIQNRYLIECDEPSYAEFETSQTKNRLNKTQKQAKQQTILRKQ